MNENRLMQAFLFTADLSGTKAETNILTNHNLFSMYHVFAVCVKKQRCFLLMVLNVSSRNTVCTLTNNK